MVTTFRFVLATSLVLPIFLFGCACNTWTLRSHEPVTTELEMSVCKSVLRDNREESKESSTVAYQRANNLLKMRKDNKEHNCAVADGTLFYESRMPTASMQVKCKTPVKGRPFKDDKNFYFSIYRQDAFNVDLNEEDILSTQQ